MAWMPEAMRLSSRGPAPRRYPPVPTDDSYFPNTKTENVPGIIGGLGWGLPGAASGGGPNCATERYTLPVFRSRNIEKEILEWIKYGSSRPFGF
jgi:hypothetical protein